MPARNDATKTIWKLRGVATRSSIQPNPAPPIAVMTLRIAQRLPFTRGRRRGGMTFATTVVQAGLAIAAGIEVKVQRITTGQIARSPTKAKGTSAIAR